MYCAIIGDIIESRAMQDRSDVQRKIKKILEEINEKFKDDIAARFTITLGDEFQGLLKSSKPLMEIIDLIKLKFYPNKLRFGIGFGEMYTEIIAEHAIGSDGPAYYAARKAIEDIKKSNNRYEQPDQDIQIYNYDENDKYKFDLLNSALSLCTLIEKGWTDKQREVITHLLFDDKSQREIANTIGLKQSSVQRRLTTGGYFTYSKARETIQSFINEIWEEFND
ncbi:MAG: hypothetical protein JEZ08_20510 [Clostridiales bacterium]|nr:hypothetical protein [Clostridiales bacterium]